MKTNLTIHHELIGTVPSVNCYRNTLDEIILRFELAKPGRLPQFGLMTPTEIKEYIAQAFVDPETCQRMCDGAVIELCAAHFYGLKGEDFNTITELIAAINCIEDELRHKGTKT